LGLLRNSALLLEEVLRDTDSAPAYRQITRQLRSGHLLFSWGPSCGFVSLYLDRPHLESAVMTVRGATWWRPIVRVKAGRTWLRFVVILTASDNVNLAAARRVGTRT